MNNTLPIFEALISDKEDGIVCVSIVDEPATEVGYVLFSKDKKKELFAVVNEEKHLLSSVIMVCDVPIYRRDANGFEYYIKYSAETIKKMAQKMLSDGTFNTFDFQHNGKRLEEGKIQLVELYIKDEEKGLNPTFIDVPNGSLMATYKIEDNEIWEMVKSGEYTGLSLEGYFSIEEAKNKNNFTKNKNIMKSIKETLRSLLMSFSEVMTDKGNLYFEGDEIAVGISVTDADGEAIADGVYETDTQLITIENSMVKEITDKEPEKEETEEVVEETVEAEAEEETTEEVVEETPETVEKGDDLKAEIEALKAQIEALTSTVEGILEKVNAPMAEPIAEQYSAIKDNEINWSNLKENLKRIRNSRI